MSESPSFYTVKDAARISGQTEENIRRHIRNGWLKARRPRPSYKIAPEDLVEWINSTMTD